MTRRTRSIAGTAAALTCFAAPLLAPTAALADAGAPAYTYQDAWYTPAAKASDKAGDVLTVTGAATTNVAAARAADLSWIDVGASTTPSSRKEGPGRLVYVNVAAHDNRAAASAPFADYSVTFSWPGTKTVIKDGKKTTKAITHRSVFAYHVNDYYPSGSDIWRTATRDGKQLSCARDWSFQYPDYSQSGAYSRFVIPAACIGANTYSVTAQSRIRATNAHTNADAVDTAGPVKAALATKTPWQTFLARPDQGTTSITGAGVSRGVSAVRARVTYATAPTFPAGTSSFLTQYSDPTNPNRLWWFSVTTDAAGQPTFRSADTTSPDARWSCAERSASFSVKGNEAALSIPAECFGNASWVSVKVPGVGYSSPALLMS